MGGRAVGERWSTKKESNQGRAERVEVKVVE